MAGPDLLSIEEGLACLIFAFGIDDDDKVKTFRRKIWTCEALHIQR